ncbi:hypothetical protein ES703_96703 [subsurface metagenome]
MLRKSLFVLVAVLLAAIPLTAQTGWMKTYGTTGTSSGWYVEQTSGGGYIVIGGRALPAQTSEVWIIKTDSNGDTIWTKSFGGHAEDWAYSGQEVSDGGYIIAGYTESFGAGNFDLWLLKTDADGDTLWTRTYGDTNYDLAMCVQQTDDEGYIITGYRDAVEHEESGYPWNGDLWLLKTDSEGDTIWTKTYGDEETWDEGNHVQQTSDGGYIIACLALYSEATLNSVMLMKTDDKGDSVWTYRAGGTQLMCVRQTADDAYVAAGIRMGDLVLLKVGEAGNLLWERIYGKTNPIYANDWADCVQETSDGGYIVTGIYGLKSYVGGYSEDGDLWLLKTDDKGDTVWTRLYGQNPQKDYGSWVQQTSDGGYIITGMTETYGGSEGNLWLIKTDSEGRIAVAEEPPVTQSDWQIPVSVGRRIVLQYTDRPQGFHAQVFDASGRKVDEIHASQASGTIIWGDTQTPGVYFIRSSSDNTMTTRKVILVK